MLKSKILKFLIFTILLTSGFLLANSVLAIDTGVNEVGNTIALGDEDPINTASRIINIALLFLGIIAVGIILYGGFVWMTSEGNEEKTSKAKKVLTSGLIGLVIILSSWGIASFVLSQLIDATDGGSNNNVTCTDGNTQACGCGGVRTCTSGSWGSCIGSDCTSEDGEVSCDYNSIVSGCQQDNSVCADDFFCNTDCSCEETKGFGEVCDVDGQGDDGICSQPDDDICGEYLSCNTETCLCDGGPVIGEVSPAGGFCNNNTNTPCTTDSDCSGSTCNTDTPNGTPGNIVSIYGVNLISEGASSTVVFLGDENDSNDDVEAVAPNTVNNNCSNGNISPNLLLVVVPDNVVSGPIEVVRGDGLSDTTNDDIGNNLENFLVNSIERPGICNVSPEEGQLGDMLTYYGLNLNTASAYFGEYDNKYSALFSDFSGDLEGGAQVPNLQSGDTSTFVKVSGVNSNYFEFDKLAEPEKGPYITEFSPIQGAPGQYVTISGSGFGSYQAESSIYFGDEEANYQFPAVCASSVWGDNKIIVKVPETLSDGNYVINFEDGEWNVDTSELTPSVFSVDSSLSLKPSLCKLEPKKGPVDSPVSLYGEYFGNEGEIDIISFYYNKTIDGTVENYEGDAQKIETIVPTDASSGPVKVIKNGNEGNAINFEVGECASDNECGTQVCCPQGTYKEGRCVNTGVDSTYQNCYIDIASSVYEWDFDTTVKNSTSTPSYYTCSLMAEDLGYCAENEFCPNSPGQCSPYEGGNIEVVGNCDYSCNTFEGCDSGSCAYNSNLDKCVLTGENCSLPENITYLSDFTATKTCNENNHWEIETETSCPDGWTNQGNNICVDESSNCEICPDGLSCLNNNDSGVCVTEAVCGDGATCNSSNECVKEDVSSCTCCCEIGEDERDCCAPLTCEGTCGSDTTDDDSGFGLCSGCANAGDTQAEMDAACNCSGTSGKYCEVTSDNPEGVCVDCSTITTASACQEHSSSCCIDAKEGNICRGGAGDLISTSPGFCAYYDCDVSNPSQCASSNPLIEGAYENILKCEDKCAEDGGVEEFCNSLTTQEECLNNIDSGCCLDGKDGDICTAGDAITSGSDVGYCAYYNCKTLNPEECATSTPVKLGEYESQSSCEKNCSTSGSGLGDSCAGEENICDTFSCGDPFSCLTESGSSPYIAPNSTGASDCGICCCDPNLPPEEDQCATLNTEEGDALSCMADKGNCTGSDRGLCCGCTTDDSCGSAAVLGCGSDACCRARPEIEETMPSHLEADVCRNTVISATFSQKMLTSSFDNNMTVLEKHANGELCPNDTKPLALGNIKRNNNNLQNNLFSRLASVFKDNIVSSLDSFLQTKAWFTETALADIPDPSQVYCKVPGSITYENQATDKTRVIFKPENLLKPSSDYFVIIKGDENLDSKSGVLNAWRIGYNGPGYWEQINSYYVEGININFNSINFPNSYIWKFTTLSEQAQNNGVCTIDYLALDPYSYLFQTTENDVNENDSVKTDSSYDTVKDRDKVFFAKAFNEDNQRIKPTTQYNWDWKWDIEDSSVVDIFGDPSLPLVDRENQKLMVAQPKITDGSTFIKITADMSNYSSTNMSLEGAGINSSAPVYVFLCQNPWPPIDSQTQMWSPWYDVNNNCDDSLPGINCESYNYSIYYCRDSGSNTTYDDLPAISDDSVVIRGSSKVCTNDGSSCEINSDCPDGDCVWNLLKESYFFQEESPSLSSITQVKDTETGGTLQLFWRSNSNLVDKYKIYYREQGSNEEKSIEVKPTDIFNSENPSSSTVCFPQNPSPEQNYTCSYLVKELKNNTTYYFKVSSLTSENVESVVSDEVSGTPTDQVPPTQPTGLSAE